MLGAERMVANGREFLGYVLEAPSVVVSDFADFSVHNLACIAAKGVKKAEQGRSSDLPDLSTIEIDEAFESHAYAEDGDFAGEECDRIL